MKKFILAFFILIFLCGFLYLQSSAFEQRIIQLIERKIAAKFITKKISVNIFSGNVIFSDVIIEKSQQKINFKSVNLSVNYFTFSVKNLVKSLKFVNASGKLTITNGKTTISEIDEKLAFLDKNFTDEISFRGINLEIIKNQDVIITATEISAHDFAIKNFRLLGKISPEKTIIENLSCDFLGSELFINGIIYNDTSILSEINLKIKKIDTRKFAKIFPMQKIKFWGIFELDLSLKTYGLIPFSANFSVLSRSNIILESSNYYSNSLPFLDFVSGVEFSSGTVNGNFKKREITIDELNLVGKSTLSILINNGKIKLNSFFEPTTFSLPIEIRHTYNFFDKINFTASGDCKNWDFIILKEFARIAVMRNFQK